jgi:hypothetical protein
MNIAITITCYNRLYYLSRVLESISKSFDFSKKKLPIYVSLDYYDDTIRSFLRSNHKEMISVININNPKLGCNQNTKKAILLGLNSHDAIIHLEDDTELSIDAIDYFIWAIEKYCNDKNIISVGGYSNLKNNEIDHNDLYKTSAYTNFICWGVCFWKHKINNILKYWPRKTPNEQLQASWDTHLNELVFSNLGNYQIRPIISRIQNIGALNGTYSSLQAKSKGLNEEEWHKNNHMAKFTADHFISHLSNWDSHCAKSYS